MVDPSVMTNYDLDTKGLQEHMLFWILAAGKNGTTAARILNRILDEVVGNGMPFNVLKQYGGDDMSFLLKMYGVGCYTHKARSIFELVRSGIDLKHCTIDQLEAIYGVGLKTSRCFLIHSRPNVQHAGLDTHVLKFLRAMGHDAPKSTPSSRKLYAKLENIFLTYAEESGKTISEFDLEIWNKYKVVSNGR